MRLRSRQQVWWDWSMIQRYWRAAMSDNMSNIFWYVIWLAIMKEFGEHPQFHHICASYLSIKMVPNMSWQCWGCVYVIKAMSNTASIVLENGCITWGQTIILNDSKHSSSFSRIYAWDMPVLMWIEDWLEWAMAGNPWRGCTSHWHAEGLYGKSSFITTNYSTKAGACAAYMH